MEHVALPDGHVALPDGHVALPDGQGVAGWMALPDGPETRRKCFPRSPEIGRQMGVHEESSPGRDQEKMLPEKPGDPPWGEKKESPSSTTVLRRHGNGRNSRRNADE